MVLARGQVRLRQTQPRLEPRTWPWRKQPCCELPETAAALTAHLTDAADARDPADTAETLELFTAKNLPDELTVRTWRAGDRLVPFGRKTPKKLQDLFTDAHIPQEHRSRFPVILAGDTIVWVPGLRRAEFARVRKDSDDPVAALRYTPTAAPPESV